MCLGLPYYSHTSKVMGLVSFVVAVLLFAYLGGRLLLGCFIACLRVCLVVRFLALHAVLSC